MLTQLIQALYSDSQRLFKVQGFTAQDFTRVNTGVIQGCPLSPLLSLLVGQAWATYAVGQSSAITAMVYIDDRGLWPKSRHPHAVDEMRTALRRSDFFDRALELQCKSEKCALAHSPQDSSMVAWLRRDTTSVALFWSFWASALICFLRSAPRLS